MVTSVIRVCILSSRTQRKGILLQTGEWEDIRKGSQEKMRHRLFWRPLWSGGREGYTPERENSPGEDREERRACHALENYK